MESFGLQVDLSDYSQIVTDANCAWLLSRTPRLTDLRLQGCLKLTPAFLGRIHEQCPSLTSLDLDHSALTDAALQCLLRGLPALGQLHLGGCAALTPSALGAFPVCARTLRTLNLRWCRAMVDSPVGRMLATLRQLEELTLLGCHRLTDAELEPIICHCPLRFLALGGCDQLTDRTLVVLASHRAQTLRVLDVAGCKGLTDCGLEAVAAGLPGLKSLDVNGCPKVTDRSMNAILEACRALETLIVLGCRSVTDASMAGVSLAPCAASLVTLRLSGSGTGDGTLSALGMLPCLRRLDARSCRGRTTREGLAVVARLHGTLRHLDVALPAAASPEAVLGASKWSRLCYLNLGESSTLDEEAILRMAGQWDSLETLLLAKCPRIDAGRLCARLAADGRLFPRLQRLQVGGCPADAAARLTQNRPRLRLDT
ncbi:putative leucine Rich Repeat family protein [Paratrimastix pyriformis]|uniref:Leucine Rich Repeat family protein n=1 Tax=Paratrimastix pyriformis TaxID=342808 RepID=A0ABQ8UP02_9EUKA|nr:putative leucine Rich Repeat family protein [Paratrimastix pyriformis]